MTGHIEELFSAAYDGVLSPAERTDFDRHVAECGACDTGYTEFRAAIDAVHELGLVRMPHPVRLPADPGVEPRRTWADRVLAWRQPMIALGAVAAVALVLVVATAQLRPHGGVGSAASSSAGGAGLAGPAYAPSISSPCSGSCSPLPDKRSQSCVAQQLSADATTAGRVPAGFNNSVTQRDAHGVIVLATPSKSYGRGETVLVYARFVDSGTGAVDLPCTGLVAGVGAQSGDGAPESVAGRGLVAAVPADLSIGGGPLLRVTIPTSAMPGDTLQLIADVPSSALNTAPAQVSLSVQVT
jgi:anti-sigma factor RsiW